MLDRRQSLLSATGPRELEQSTAELLGAQLHRALYRPDDDLHLVWWFAELAKDVLNLATRPAPENDPARQSAWRLLHGLIAIAPSDLFGEDVQQLVDSNVREAEPSWLTHVCRVQATGASWRMTDIFGTRMAVIAAYEYPGGIDPHVYLFDVDACGPLDVVGAGVFDTVDAAARSWQATVGPAASNSRLDRVTDPADLSFLPFSDDPTAPTGFESHNRMDNWFRTGRRIDELVATLRRRGTPIPPPVEPRDAPSVQSSIEHFTEWFAVRHDAPPAPNATAQLISVWLDGLFPGTRACVSPHRVTFLKVLIGTWPPGRAAAAAWDLLPEWARYLGERAGLSASALSAIAAAAQEATAESCGSAHLLQCLPLGFRDPLEDEGDRQ
ncbi:hypothetical protein [Nocardia crassostreae]|uniref:hypothetical protein n=1 Tax=Nocardia crassostreae TaxID=53428 RepID=UPI00083671FF|nr:hypothetical protein [Nocardia crassostreae]